MRRRSMIVLRAPRLRPKKWIVRKRSMIVLALFFFLFWLSVWLSSVMVHESGHGVTDMIAGGWHNSIALVGVTESYDPALVAALVEQARNSGVSPDEWTQEQGRIMLLDLVRQLGSVRYGFIGGWIAQLVATFLVFLIYRSRVFQANASSFSRLFWGGFVLFNLAWVGGVWFLCGLWTLEWTDALVFVEIILQGNPIALGMLWVEGLGLIGLALFLADGYGGRIFAPLGLSETGAQKLALSWTGAGAVAGFLVKLPMNEVVGMVIECALMIAVPLWVSVRLIRRGERPPRAPGYAWLGTSLIVIVITLMVVTTSGLLIGGDEDALWMQAIEAYYCEQVHCVPESPMQ